MLPDSEPYAYALPGGPRDRIVVSTGMLACLTSPERRALFAHERTHLSARHHRHLLTVQLAACTNPFLWPLRSAVTYMVERWADEQAAEAIGSRKAVARAIGKAALVSGGASPATLASLAAPGPLPRRVAALLGPPPTVHAWPPAFTTVGLALWTATGAPPCLRCSRRTRRSHWHCSCVRLPRCSSTPTGRHHRPPSTRRRSPDSSLTSLWPTRVPCRPPR